MKLFLQILIGPLRSCIAVLQSAESERETNMLESRLTRPKSTQAMALAACSPTELVPHLIQVVSSPAELRLHVVTAAVKLSLHGLHFVGGERKAASQVFILLLEYSG